MSVLGDGSKSPIFAPVHTIARSGTIPHGSTIQLIGGHEVVEEGNRKPAFPEGIAAWEDSDHLAISPSMGGGGRQRTYRSRQGPA
jgi:hypothetical protein